MSEFVIKDSVAEEFPLLIGLMGQPGGGKTFSALRLATGMQRVRPGPIVLIDTDRKRSQKYSSQFKFRRLDLQPPFRSDRFLDAVQFVLKEKPCAIIIDSASDEHDGPGGYLEWHDEEVPKSGGNEWAAWKKPKAARIKMLNGLLQITTPIILTFRAREKTKLVRNDKGKMVPQNIGYQPIAPMEIIHQLDLTCLLPPRADGVAVWRSDKIGEDFVIKLPNFLQPYIKEGAAFDEDTGEALARWAKGETVNSQSPRSGETAPSLPSAQTAETAPATGRSPRPGAGATSPEDEGPSSDDVAQWDKKLAYAAENGQDALRTTYETVPKDIEPLLRVATNRRHKPRAAEVDRLRTETAEPGM